MAGCSLFGVRSSIETAPFSVVESRPDRIEIRHYPSRVAVEARLPGGGGPMARGRAFRLLFAYISGANARAAKVAMTTPVESGESGQRIAMTAPVESGSGAAGVYTMRFFLPAAFSLETAPRPTDPRVGLVAVPDQTMAVRRFAGLRGRPMVDRQTARLRHALADSGWQPDGAAVAWFHDPPSTLPPFRCNEVAIPVRPRGPSDS